jgi:hypothetical protein
MIPTIETIIEDLIAGRITKPAAITWLLQHAEDAHADLRDHFASQCVAGLLANSGGPVQHSPMSGWDFCNCTPNNVAQTAYGMADAMMKAREQP